MDITCGSFVIDDKNRILLCQPTGYDNDWTVPKGLLNEDEDVYRAAIRELKEETGIYIHDYPHKMYELGIQSYPNKNKMIIGFAFELFCTIDQDLVCDSFFYDKVTKRQLPEISDYVWYPVDKVTNILRSEQKKLLKVYLDRVNKNKEV